MSAEVFPDKASARKEKGVIEKKMCKVLDPMLNGTAGTVSTRTPQSNPPSPPLQSFTIFMGFNPSDALDAVILSRETVLRTEAGHDEDAEQRHRQALELKIANFGADSVNTAISYNALGEAFAEEG
ncbi:hypothetical protein FS837_003635 [Tulasnella sp. UAMH 9824]|nr:hypothetical protein FS837_003635 [Tulasnella sp. UAMH 9824]